MRPRRLIEDAHKRIFKSVAIMNCGLWQSEIKRYENLCNQFLFFLDMEIIMLRNIYTERRDRNYSLIDKLGPTF